MSLNHQQKYNERIHQWILKVKEKALSLSRSKGLMSVSCSVCRDSKSRQFVHNDSLQYVKCLNCDLVYMSPRPPAEEVDQGFLGKDPLLKDYFEIVIDHYDPNKIEAVQDAEKDSQLRDISKFKKEGRLLDVGCSVGKFLQKSKSVFSVEGVEINPVTRKVAEKDFRVHADFLHNLDLPAVYDVVTLNQILYGVPDPVSLLRDIRKILRADGVLYINTPNSDSFAVELFQGKANHFYGYTTLNVFNETSLTKLAELAGFKVLFSKTEWFDIYAPDVMVFLKDKERFIHKRNIQVEGYEALIKSQDEAMEKYSLALGKGGNYLVSILGKA